MKQNWWRSASYYKQNHFVFKLGLSILLLGFGFRLLFSQSSNVIPNETDNNNNNNININNNNINDNIDIDTPVLDNDVKPKPLDFVESPKDISQFQPEDNESGKCDITDGEWIPSSSSPAYTNSTCRWIESHQDCMGNGRPDAGYMYWKWSPKGCELPRFDAKKFLETMRDKSWAFVGDSITRNHLQSFLCLLSQVEDAVELYHDKDYKDRKWHFPSYNLTVSVIWSPFLAKADIFEDIDGVSSSEIQLHIDILDKTWTELFDTWDYVLFSSGKWFIKSAIYYENNSVLGCHGCTGKNYTDLGFNFAYRKILKNLFDFILKSNRKSMVIYRTSTPDHFENGTWSTGGSCDRTVPAKEGDFEMSELNRLLREIELPEVSKAEERASEKGMKLKLLDVMPLSLVRPDGHPGPYRHFYPFAEDKNAKVQYDCLHWCLPGPIDSWNDMLMNLVVNG
ncbi:putative PMR5 domain, PC-Esterase [Helianthus annuus]|uniref:PMR5 domain, PC-Esterase n=1 Tax=Helianthus annuus TaxID=4232 RepID=A0A251RKS6_HELAN|nr:protein trichome birefringence-like 23 [Helianthus annuus]KAF5753519.1 putative PMR5 domain, PC-Esterase [Helianthus annuus]KAJ0431411.1 putative PMR5 domain, PC-Esterase [Helianthus annuus]KAJ0811306.1 putative PMR5 domain, PC-Esterase [Helianthus annuus]KAJ0824355.1 putative PMR5 domain, PC-Esterase [Helianthus annuus]